MLLLSIAPFLFIGGYKLKSTNRLYNWREREEYNIPPQYKTKSNKENILLKELKEYTVNNFLGEENDNTTKRS